MAIYPPPPFPGGNYPSPFPCTCSSSPSPASSFPSAPDLRYAATYPPQIHHHHPFGFGAPAYAPAPFPAYTPAPVPTAVTHSFPLPYVSAPAPFPSTFPPPTSSSTSFPFGSSHASVYAPAPAVSSPIPTQIDRNQPPPPPAFPSASSTGSSPAHDVPSPQIHVPPVAAPFPHPPSPPGLFPAPAYCKTEHDDGAISRYDRNFCSNAVHDKFRSSSDDLSKGTNTRGASIHRPTPSTPARVTSTPVTGGRSRTPSWLLDNVRTPPNQECTPFQSSVNSLHGEISKLSALVSQLAVDMGLQTTTASTASTAAPVPSLFCAAVDSSGNFPSAAPTAAYVAPKVFDEKPTPSSGYENFSGHPIQSSCVQSGSTNLSEQLLAGMPHHYGFENLKRPSVFLADGSEHKFYTLPEDYPLEKATKPMSPTTGTNVGARLPPSVAAHAADVASVLGFKSNITAGSDSLLIPSLQLPMNVQEDSLVIKQRPVYGLYEEDTCLNGMEKQLARRLQKASDNAFSGQPRRSFSKVQKTEQTSDDVSVYALDLQQKDEERAYSSAVIKASNSSITRSSQLNIAYSMRELRLLWDPGACVSTFPSWHPQLLFQQEGTAEHALLLAHSRPTETIQTSAIPEAPAATYCQVLDSALDMKYQQVPRVHEPFSIYLWLQRLTARITTEKTLSRVPIPEPTQWQSQVTSVSFVWDPGTRLLVHKSKWWFVYTEDMTNWYTNIKFNGVALWLFHSLPP